MSLTVTHDIGSRDPLRRFHTRAVFTEGPAGQGYGAANFPAVKRPSNVSGHRHRSVAFRPPTTPMRFFALQRLRPGRSTHPRVLPARFDPSAGFGHPLDGLLPAQPCRPCFRPAALLGLALQRLLRLAVERHSCRSEPTGWLQIRPLIRASTSTRRIPPSLGFAPQACPSSDGGCYSATWLVPLLGFSSLGFVLRSAWPALQPADARWLVHPRLPGFRSATRRIPTDRPSRSAKLPAIAGNHPILQPGADQKTPARFRHLFMTLWLKTVRTDWPDF